VRLERQPGRDQTKHDGIEEDKVGTGGPLAGRQLKRPPDPLELVLDRIA
jgi:hypothetical protein